MALELWDLYDKDGARTGEVWERSFGNYRTIPDGRYHLVSYILVHHSDGTFLLTKRHIDKDVYPGYWEASAGGSASGQAATRSTHTELNENRKLCACVQIVSLRTVSGWRDSRGVRRA